MGGEEPQNEHTYIAWRSYHNDGNILEINTYIQNWYWGKILSERGKETSIRVGHRIKPTFRWCSGKELACQCHKCKKRRFYPQVRKIPCRRAQQSTPVFLPGEFHEQRSLAGYSPWGLKELDMTEHTHSQRNIKVVYFKSSLPKCTSLYR